MTDPDPATKKCTRCEKIKPVDEFFRSKNMVDGRNRQCKECHKEMHGSWVENNPERVQQIRHRYYLSIKKRERQRRSDRSRTARTEAILAYGKFCTCCFDGYLPFLQIVFPPDFPKGINLYEHVRKLGYPDGPYVICSNCKQAHDLGEVCHAPITRAEVA